MIAAAVILPLLIFLGIQFAFEARDQRRQVEAGALARTERVIVEVDGARQRTLGLLDDVAAARPLEGEELRLAYQRLQLIRAIERSWVIARLEDRRTGQVLFALLAPVGTRLDRGGFDPPPGTGSASAVGIRSGDGRIGRDPLRRLRQRQL